MDGDGRWGTAGDTAVVVDIEDDSITGHHENHEGGWAHIDYEDQDNELPSHRITGGHVIHVLPF